MTIAPLRLSLFALLLALPSAATPQPVGLEVRGLTVERDPVGHLRFLFEVVNRTSRPVAQVRAVVRLMDAAEQVLGEAPGRAWLETIAPGRSAPVVAVFADPSPFAQYRIELDVAEADNILSRIHPATRIVAARWRIGQFVPYEILGKVANQGAEVAYNLSLVVACYDAQRRVVAIALGHPQRLTLEPGQASPFRIEVLHSAAEVALCKVHVAGARP